jgi:flagella basal body P-ring formation protein FlgA
MGVAGRAVREAVHAWVARHCRRGGAYRRQAAVCICIGRNGAWLEHICGMCLAYLSAMDTHMPRIDWILTLCVVAAALVAVPAAAAAQAAHPLDEIRQVAERFITSQLPDGAGRVHASADALDPRLRLPRCGNSPSALLPAGASISARTAVGVSCAQPKWTVYVPVRVETELPVLVLQKSMPRNSAVGAADVEIRTQRVPGLSTSYIGSTEQLAGRHLKRPTPAGTLLTAELMAADILVRRGQRVTLVASAGGIEVRTQGEAIQDAGPTGRVRVLNLTSRRIVEGQVESRDQVRVSL